MRARRLEPERLAPVLAALVVAALWLAIRPHTVDMAAHTFRASLFGSEGFTVWNGQWYAGHHTPAYSVLFPPLAWALSPWVAGALSTVAAAALFEPLARWRWGERARWGALWFGIGTGSLLFTGRLPFAMGVAFGVGAMLAIQRRRTALAATAAASATLASPIAGLFVTLFAFAFAVAREQDERRPAIDVALWALLPTLLLALVFPEGGYMPFDFTTYLPVPVFCAVMLIALPRSERGLRFAAVLYAAGATLALLVQTPMGSNAVRLGTLFGGPIFLCAVARPRGAARTAAWALVVAGLVFWQWTSPARDFAASQNEPSAKTSYYRPLLAFLETERPENGRVEIPFTRSHWEAAVVAPRFPLARGWERQLDTVRDPLFYKGILTDFTYANWLAEHAVALVALPDVKPDVSSFKERGLIERNPPYLRLIRRVPHWRIYEVTLPHATVIPSAGAEATLERLRSDEVVLDFRRAGAALVRVRWSPYWYAQGACVERVRDWTRVVATRPGRVRMTMRFSPERVLLRGRRCG